MFTHALILSRKGPKRKVFPPLCYYLYCRGEVNPLYELFTISYDTAVVTPIKHCAEPELEPETVCSV